MKRILPVLMILCVSFPLVSKDKEIKVRGATGEWVINDVTLEQARNKALTEAKLEALRMAGITEAVNAESVLLYTGKEQRYGEFSSIEIGGAVTGFTVTDERVEQLDYGGKTIAVVRVTIDAAVMKYSRQRDPSFRIKVEGIKSAYDEMDLLRFSMTPHRTGYLKIFVFESDNRGSMLYPNRYEPAADFEPGVKVEFPVRELDYRLVKQNDELDSEINYMIFVYTKEDIPFMENDIDFHTVVNWIAGISPDMRTEYRTMFFINKN